MIGPRLGIAAVAAGAVVLMAAVSAGASSGLTYKVVAGTTARGTVGFTGKTGAGTVGSPTLTFTDTSTSTAIGCKSGTMHGTVTLGRTRTAQLATITTTAAKRCSAFDGYASLTYKQKGTWSLHGVTKTAHGKTNVSINAVTLVLSSSPCTLTVTGTADGTYSNASKKLTVQPRTGSGHALKASHVTGCGGVITNGDKIVIAGASHCPPRKARSTSRSRAQRQRASSPS